MSFCLPESLLPGKSSTHDDDYQLALMQQEQEHDVAHMRQKQREQQTILDHQMALKMHRTMANDASMSQTQLTSDEYYARKLQNEEYRRSEEGKVLDKEAHEMNAAVWSSAELQQLPQATKESVTFCVELPFQKYADVKVLRLDAVGEVCLVVEAVPLPILKIPAREIKLNLSVSGQKGTLSQSDILVHFPTKTTLHVSVLACRLRSLPQMNTVPVEPELTFTDIQKATIHTRHSSFGYESDE